MIEYILFLTPLLLTWIDAVVIGGVLLVFLLLLLQLLHADVPGLVPCLPAGRQPSLSLERKRRSRKHNSWAVTEQGWA